MDTCDSTKSLDICQFILFYWQFSSRHTRTSSGSCRARWWWGARPSPRPAAAAPWWPPWPRPPRCPRSPRWSRPRPAPRCLGSSGPRRGSGGTKCSPGPEARLCWYTHSCQHQGHCRKLNIDIFHLSQLPMFYRNNCETFCSVVPVLVIVIIIKNSRNPIFPSSLMS